MKDKLKDLIEEMEQEIESCERRIEIYGENHSSSFRLHMTKKSISKYLAKLKNIYEATGSEVIECERVAEVCLHPFDDVDYCEKDIYWCRKCNNYIYKQT